MDFQGSDWGWSDWRRCGCLARTARLLLSNPYQPDSRPTITGRRPVATEKARFAPCDRRDICYAAGVMPEEARPTFAHFPSTIWSQVRAAAGTAMDGPEISEFCRAYWRPLYAFLRRGGYSPHDASDFVQGFLSRLIERGDIDTVAPEKGRFRTYLLAGLKNYVSRQKERASAGKRGGGNVVSMDPEEAERICGPDLRTEFSPELAYDRAWARTMLDRALARLRDEHRARNKESFFEALAPYLDGAQAGDYESTARHLGMSRGAVAVAVNRLRGRLWELLRGEAAQTVGSPEEAEEELRGVLRSLSAG